MRILAKFFVAGCLLGSSAQAQVNKPPNLECFIGPIIKEVGKTFWQVTSCNDNKSLVFATIAKNPAMPIMFIRQFKDGTYTLFGEGTGDKSYTNAAFEDLKTRSDEEFSKLIEETKQVNSLKLEEQN